LSPTFYLGQNYGHFYEQVLPPCKACHLLEKIAISDDDPEVEEHAGSSFSVVRELLYFTQLRSLRLSIYCSINLDNGLLLEVVSGCPQLHTLSLYDIRHLSTRVPFRGLFAALRRCPQLRALNVELDVVKIDIDPNIESSLITFGVRDSPAADAEAIARIIFAMPPNV
jgi:hypothetical protein